MPTCARCGESTDESPPDSDYAYCNGCLQTFDRVEECGVVVRYRSNHAAALPQGYWIISPWEGEQFAGSQTKALAEAKKMMELYDTEGLFIYQRTRSRWLISEYLDAHPRIAEDVRKENQGLLARLLG